MRVIRQFYPNSQELTADALQIFLHGLCEDAAKVRRTDQLLNVIVRFQLHVILSS